MSNFSVKNDQRALSEKKVSGFGCCERVRVTDRHKSAGQDRNEG